jgi:hypothetical protein
MKRISDDGGSVELLLRELYAKKRWLDMVIGGLEAALESPQHQLVRLVQETLGDESPARPKVDLGDERRVALANLARTIGARNPPALRRRRSSRADDGAEPEAA